MKVIALKDHPNGAYNKGDIFPILNTKTRGCCGATLLDIGIKLQPWKLGTTCTDCGHVELSKDVWWLNSKNFAPLIDDDILQ